MSEHIFDEKFKSYCAASFGVADPTDLPDQQRLQLEDAYYYGASIGFYQGFGCDDEEALAAHAQLKNFGNHIVDRYREAGLPLGQRRS